MVNASQAFHTAVKAGSPQRALLLFDDYIFTNDDIAASAGITYEEYMNPETDLTVGQCPSAAIEFTILNYEGLFETFTGGEFRAYLGVETNSEAYLHSGNCYAVDSQGAAFTGHDTAPYLREDGVDPGIDPGFPVKSIVIFDGVIYVLGENDQACALVRNGGSYLPAKLTAWSQVPQTLPTWAAVGEHYEWGSLIRKDATNYTLIPKSQMGSAAGTLPASDFLAAKARLYVSRGSGLAFGLDTLTNTYRMSEWASGVAHYYEYVPLGVFTAMRPERVRGKTIRVTGYDRMSSLDTELPAEFFQNFTGTTLSQMYTYAATTLGLPYRQTAFPANDGLSVANKLTNVEGMTGRELLGLIAQAACANARFDREGVLSMDWWMPTESEEVVSIDEDNYSEFTPAEYTVPPVTGVIVRNSDQDTGVYWPPSGGGTEALIIQDNPFLSGNQPATTNIYNCISDRSYYAPGSVSWFGDWSLRAGDIVKVSQGGRDYRFPVFHLSMRWNGMAKIVLEATGEKTREGVSAVQRREWRDGRKVHELTSDLDTFRSFIGYTGEDGQTFGSLIQQELERITIQADNIDLRGYTTINGFTIDETGKLQCTGGTIGGFTITADKISAGNDFWLKSDGTLKLGAFTLTSSTATFDGTIYAGNISVGGDGDGTMDGDKLSDYAVYGRKVDDGAISYGKTASGVQGSLDNGDSAKAELDDLVVAMAIVKQAQGVTAQFMNIDVTNMLTIRHNGQQKQIVADANGYLYLYNGS